MIMIQSWPFCDGHNDEVNVELSCSKSKLRIKIIIQGESCDELDDDSDDADDDCDDQGDHDDNKDVWGRCCVELLHEMPQGEFNLLKQSRVTVVALGHWELG